MSYLNKIGNLDRKPKYIAPEYLEKHFTCRKVFTGDGGSLELSAIQANREFVSLKAAQNEMLENAKNRKNKNVRKIKELYGVLNTLKEKFSRTDKFINECEEEEARATTKINYEIQMQKRLWKNIVKYKERIHKLCEFKEKLAATIEEMEPYEDVSRKIVDKFDFTKSVNDFTSRCDSLMLAQDEIVELEQQKIKEIEEMRKEMAAATNVAALTVLGLNNDLIEMQRSYTKAVTECHFWEKRISLVEKHIRSNELKTYRIQDALHQMIKLLLRRKEWGLLVEGSDVERQFDFIHEEISILKSVIKLYENESKSKINFKF